MTTAPSPSVELLERALAEAMEKSTGSVDQVIGLLRTYGSCLSDVQCKAVHNQGSTALHCAAAHCHSALALEVIALGADVSVQDANGATPLHIAISGRTMHVAQALLAAGALTNILDHDGNLPLHAAVWSANLDAVLLLLRDGTVENLDVPNKSGHTPAELAVRLKNSELTAAFAEFRKQQRLFTGNTSTTSLLTSLPMSPRSPPIENMTAKSPTQLCGSSGAVHQSQPDEERRDQKAASATHAATSRTHVDMTAAETTSKTSRAAPTVEKMVEFSLGATDMMEIAIAYAGMDSDLDLAMSLLERHRGAVAGHAAPRRNRQTILHRAAIQSRPDVARAALRWGADADARESAYNSTPAAAAAAVGAIEVIHTLADGGADLNVVGAFGSPLHHAIFHGRRAVVRVLLDRGADSRVKDAQGCTPRQLAKRIAGTGNEVLVQMLPPSRASGGSGR